MLSCMQQWYKFAPHFLHLQPQGLPLNASWGGLFPPALSNFSLHLHGPCIVSLFSFSYSFLLSSRLLRCLSASDHGSAPKGICLALDETNSLMRSSLSGFVPLHHPYHSLMSSILCLSGSICLVLLLMHSGMGIWPPFGNELWKWRFTPAGIWSVSREWIKLLHCWSLHRDGFKLKACASSCVGKMAGAVTNQSCLSESQTLSSELAGHLSTS